MLPKVAFVKNAEVYKILANPIRLEILNLLKSKDMSLDQLTKTIRIRKPNVSQHLAVLRHFKLVDVTRSGQGAYYKIVDSRIVAPCEILHRMRTRHQI